MKQPILPKGAKVILDTLSAAGYEAYIVGGCVRDCILDRSPQDWDITTSAQPEQVKSLFSHTFDTGIQHGTITVVLDKTNYEVTTYRIDGEYLDGRHPEEVIFTTRLEEDLLRRDFTMNAIAYHPKEGYKDPFQGRKDIEQKIIRGVGETSARFQEDALRMLRAIRFSAQLGFEIEIHTYQALLNNTVLIGKISVERIKEELEKVLNSRYIEMVPLLWKSGLLKEISPLLSELLSKSETETTELLKQCPQDLLLKWTILLRDMTLEQAEKFLKYLKTDLNTQKGVVQLLQCKSSTFPTQAYPIRKEMGRLGELRFRQWIELEKLCGNQQESVKTEKIVEEILYRKDCLTLKELEVTGNDLMASGLKKGKAVGEMLGYLLDMVQQEPEKNQKEFLLETAKKRMKNNSESCCKVSSNSNP